MPRHMSKQMPQHVVDWETNASCMSVLVVSCDSVNSISEGWLDGLSHSAGWLAVDPGLICVAHVVGVPASGLPLPLLQPIIHHPSL